MRYVYDDIETALTMSDKFKELFLDEGLYVGHNITPLRTGRYMVNIKVAVE